MISMCQVFFSSVSIVLLILENHSTAILYLQPSVTLSLSTFSVLNKQLSCGLVCHGETFDPISIPGILSLPSIFVCFPLLLSECNIPKNLCTSSDVPSPILFLGLSNEILKFDLLRPFGTVTHSCFSLFLKCWRINPECQNSYAAIVPLNYIPGWTVYFVSNQSL